MQQQCWIHPVGSMEVSKCTSSESLLSHSTAAQGLRALFLTTGVLSILLTLFVIALNAKNSLVTEILFSRFKAPSAATQIRDSAKNSPSARVAVQQRHYVSSRVQYISDLIKRTGKKVSEGERRLARAIVLESIKASYDPLLVAAVIKAESTFDRHAVSSQGAQGLMQLLPETGEYISRRASLNWEGSSKLREIEYNIRLGIAYLKYLEDKFGGDTKQALIAYNWGPGNLWLALKNQRQVPSNPMKYAQKILASHETFKRELELRMARSIPLEQASLYS